MMAMTTMTNKFISRCLLTLGTSFLLASFVAPVWSDNLASATAVDAATGDPATGTSSTSGASPTAVPASALTPTPEAKKAFENMLKNYFPLTPDEIQQFKNRAAIQSEANARPAGDSPSEGVSGVIQVSMKPGDAMPVVRIGQGMITSLIFTDAAGQVWPITSYSIGDPSAFNIQWTAKSGVMMVQGQKLYTQTNMGVMLEGMQVPVMLTFLIGQKSYDYMDYIRIQGYQAGDQDAGNQQAEEAPEYLVKTLEGIPPDGSHVLQVSGADAQMWSYNGNYLLLTRTTLLSPAWTAKFVGTGPNALHVYELSKTPYILLSNNGTIERLTVTGGDDNA